ncbi:glycosyltransferase family 2 protein [Streptomyces sp. NPDC001941]|uniref:glycosyltransferase family 2 protein n=1 Tax=Streptomyces sp. NPDC001941 TaxID=3154659 RepID=UPI003320FAE8
MDSPVRSGGPAAPAPDVSVVMAVRDSMPYLVACLRSLFSQSLGPSRLEVIAVDAGSTDGSGRELDRWAGRHPRLTVRHLAAAGGPGGHHPYEEALAQARNQALDLARGRYVFVVEPDDFLGEEALERLVAMADAQGSDITLGKHVGVGRPVATRDHRHAERVDPADTEVYRRLDPMKLFRRRLLVRNGIYFPTDLPRGGEQVFTARAYLAADTVSAVGDYDCYHVRHRERPHDGRPVPADAPIAYIERLMELVGTSDADPDVRRTMLAHLFRALTEDVLAVAEHVDPDHTDRQAVRARAARLCDTWWDDALEQGLAPLTRLRLHCFRTGRHAALRNLFAHDPAHSPPATTVLKGRAYLRLPYFRDPAVGLPDALYDITGELRVVHELERVEWSRGVLRLTGRARIDGLATGYRGTELIARERATGAEHRVQVRGTANSPSVQSGSPRRETLVARRADGFTASLDLASAADGAPLGPGIWDLHLSVHAEGIRKRVRLGARRADAVDLTARRGHVVAPAGRPGRPDLVAHLFWTDPHGNLSVEVGHRLPLPDAPDPRQGRGGGLWTRTVLSPRISRLGRSVRT